MRLICGCYHLDGHPASSELLAVMAGKMTAAELTPQVRIWCDGPVGLAVLDFREAAHTRVPLPESGGGCVLAADLRLDAPGDLAQALGQREASEDALLLAALDRWGSEAPVHVLGDYAFAAWDARTRQLLCARDALGVRPLVYVHQPGRLFAFASLPCGLYGAGLIERRLDELTLARQIVQAWQGYIHVHHLTALSNIGETYEVDPVTDLRPVCPNCHAVIHLGGETRTPEEVRQLLEAAKRANTGLLRKSPI